ncbi:MAG: hypothetical protein AVDCRST_MAG30-3634, partial [uncultured Solirubrobacteraceae bacterium]
GPSAHQLLSGRARGRRRSICVLQRDLEALGSPRGGRQPPDCRQVRRYLGDLDRALRSGGGRPGGREPREGARRDPRRALHVPQPEGAQEPAVLEWTQGTHVRAVRAGRAVARAPHVAHPRPRQRRPRRQPAREPPDRLRQLQRDARHALRQAAQTALPGAVLRALRRPVHPEDRGAAVLLADVRRALGPARDAAARSPQGGPAAVPRASPGDRGGGIRGGGSTTRRLGERHPEVDPRLRGAAAPGLM